MVNTDNIRSRLIQYLKELHLPTIRESFEEIAHQAQQESLSYERYLLELIEKECEDRRHRRIERFLRESCLPLEKRMDSFDLKRLPVKVKNQVNLLLEGFFLDKNENVLAFGNPGTGKTHLLCGISHALIREGRRICFTTPPHRALLSFSTRPSQRSDKTRYYWSMPARYSKKVTPRTSSPSPALSASLIR